MNYKDRCRTCLGNSKEMRHFQTTIVIAGVDVRLIDILDTFYNFEITSKKSFPENICINCVYQLTLTYSFKVLIEKSSKILEQRHIDSSADNNATDLVFDDCKNYDSFSPPQYQDDNVKTIKELFCVECKGQFTSTKLLNEHCNIQHPVKSTIGRNCDYCSEKFEDFGILIRHMKLHLKPYVCDSCWKGFYNMSDLESHQCRTNQSKKSVDKVIQQCEQCGKSYPSGYIKLHIKTHGNDTPYACKYCPKKFKVRCSLNSHILWKHKKTRNHSCHICNAAFVSASSRSSHIRKEHYKEKKHTCVTCGKGFFQRSDMKRHYLKHTGVKNFHCEICGKSYQTRYGLNVHLKSHSHEQFTRKIEKNQIVLA